MGTGFALPICKSISPLVAPLGKIEALAPPAKSLVYTAPAVARLVTAIVCVPATAEVVAVALSTLVSEEVADCAVSAPRGSASALTEVARLVRALLMAVKSLAWLCSVDCSPCHSVNWPLLSLRIWLTRLLTSSPCPLSSVAGFRLMPTIASFCLRRSRTGLRFQVLPKILGDSQIHTQHLGAGHLQDGSSRDVVHVLDHDLVLQLTVGLHLHYILRLFLLGGGLLRLLDFLV